MANKFLSQIIFFFFLANLCAISAINAYEDRRSALSIGGFESFDDPCKVGLSSYVGTEIEKLGGECDEGDMVRFSNAVSCSMAWLLDHRPYRAAEFIYEYHQQNTEMKYLIPSLLSTLDGDPAFISKCYRKGDREALTGVYQHELSLMLQDLDEKGMFSEIRSSPHIHDDDEQDYDDLENSDYV